MFSFSFALRSFVSSFLVQKFSTLNLPSLATFLSILFLPKSWQKLVLVWAPLLSSPSFKDLQTVTKCHLSQFASWEVAWYHQHQSSLLRLVLTKRQITMCLCEESSFSHFIYFRLFLTQSTVEQSMGCLIRRLRHSWSLCLNLKSSWVGLWTPCAGFVQSDVSGLVETSTYLQRDPLMQGFGRCWSHQGVSCYRHILFHCGFHEQCVRSYPECLI